MINIDNLTFAYPGASPVFEAFGWEVKGEESWSVLGPSGCGKSTLLYLLAGLRFPAGGSILIHGRELSHTLPGTGLILQDYGLLPWATVRENIRLGLRIRKFYGPDGKHAPSGEMPPDADAQVNFWLRRLGLEAVSSKYPAHISGGQRQRTAIARTLALNPDLLLMDEPFASLDAPTRADLQQLVIELCAEQKITSVLVTHSIEEAALMGEKILILSRPPIRQAPVILNLSRAVPGYQNSPAFLHTCGRLRQAMGDSR
jgi:ABC-type nitrate/sulfonate/bicarbonate transport system ATPase subunit